MEAGVLTGLGERDAPRGGQELPAGRARTPVLQRVLLNEHGYHYRTRGSF